MVKLLIPFVLYNREPVVARKVLAFPDDMAFLKLKKVG